MPENSKHMGWKTSAKFLGWLLGFVVLVFEFLVNWIPASAITVEMIAKVLTIAATAVFGIPAVYYIGDIIWALADKVKETITAGSS